MNTIIQKNKYRNMRKKLDNILEFTKNKIQFYETFFFFFFSLDGIINEFIN